MTDVYPVDYTSDVGRIRKYIPDVIMMQDPADWDAEPAYMWHDNALQSFLDDELPTTYVPGDPAPRTAIWRAAAAVMVATANNEALVLKKIITEDLQTDGAAVAKALLAGAKALSDRADDEDKAINGEEVFLTVFDPPFGFTPTHVEGTSWNRPWDV